MTGRVVVQEPGEDLAGATVVVRVEESSRADAPAKVVAERVVVGQPGAGGTPFELVVPAVDPRGSYRVTASADLDGDGEIGRGDYLSMASFPVITRGWGLHAVFEVRRID